jgi:MFS family permease
VLRLRPFAVLYTAETTSIAGDQLARIALAVLVFDRTGSAAATALTYATTFLPAILGGFLLAGAGDRISRRVVLVSCNIIRAGLFAAMAMPSLPIWSLLAILVIAVFFEPAFAASEVSYLAEALDAEQYRAATGLRMVTNQAAQVIGFALGGVVVAALDPRSALLIDAATFLGSALVIAVLLPGQRRTAGAALDRGARRPRGPALWRNRDFRYFVALSALAGFFVVPEGLAVPFGRSVGATTAETGALLASIPLGGALGAFVLIKLVSSRSRLPVSLAMAVGCGLPLLISVFAPPWPVVGVFWLASGALSAYQVEINSALIHQIPDQVRAQWMGIVSSLLIGAQGLGLIVFGVVAEWVSTGASIAIAGTLGVVAAVGVCRARARSRRADAHQAGLAGVGSATASIK